MHKRPFVITGIFVLIVCLATLVGWFYPLLLPVRISHRREFRIGNEIVRRVEAFRMQHGGRLPEAVDEIGIEDPDLDVFYRKVSNDKYWVWFGTTLGESETYHSREKKWD